MAGPLPFPAFPAPDRGARPARAERGSTAAARAPAPLRSRGQSQPNTLRLGVNGVLFEVSYAGQARLVADSPGLRCLTALVAEPGAEIAALALEQQWLVDHAPSAGRCTLHDARLRARDAVRDAVTTALDALAAVHPAAAEHLRTQVHLDPLCRYDPGVAADVGTGHRRS